ncbi:MAG: M14 family metallopeptidase [Candidatus Riflebacteria bacterium]|nr:M14 family metallopeptidase [Candidatus Riflebacteria bacterium]
MDEQGRAAKEVTMPSDKIRKRSPRVPRAWLTRFELSDRKESPPYDETMAFFARLAAASEFARLVPYGVSPQGRALNCLVVDRAGAFDPERAAGDRAVVLIQCGIHSGEIEGKDACMMLLREILITGESRDLLDHLILLVIPIVNVDGHERSSPTNRPNQDGPRQMGWRTTAHNLNLNRDYMKADAPEMQALLALNASWRPDLSIDCHTTDGGDHRYHVMYGLERHQNIDPELGAWGQHSLMPEVMARVEELGFLAAPYFDVKGDLYRGVSIEPGIGRYSTGYGALQNRLCLLIETHSLKPFDTRMFVTKATIEAVLAHVAAHAGELKRMNRDADDRAARAYGSEGEEFPLRVTVTDEPEPFMFEGFETFEEESQITGAPVLRYSGVPARFEIPLFAEGFVEETVVLPRAYAVPGEFGHLVQVLRLHGIDVARLEADLVVTAQRYRFTNVTFAARPYEGRQLVNCVVEPFAGQVQLPAGTFVVPTAQRAVRVIAHLLEPGSEDSFGRWGFFSAFFERKEYAEPYILEPIALEMLDADPELAEECEKRLDRDDSFRDDPEERLDFFYQRSPFFDRAERVYPIVRIADDRTFARVRRLLGP